MCTRKLYISVFFLFAISVIDLHASELSECKGSPIEVDSKNDTFTELRKSWTNCSAALTWTDGNKYVGEFKDGKYHGQGTFTFPSGAKYVGEFNNDERHGQGAYTFANGDKYVGEWKDDKLHGQGTKTFANGDKYVGEWKDNKLHGQGTYTFADGGKYVGEFKDSQRNGQGIHYYANGDIYDGGWQGEKWHGKGVLYEKDQYRVIVSEFINHATHPTKSNFAFEVSQSDIFLRCLYKGVQGYKQKDNSYDDYRNVGGMEILLEGYKLKKKGYLQSLSLNFKKEYSLIGEPSKTSRYYQLTDSKNYVSTDTRMDVLRNQLECDDYCIKRYMYGNTANIMDRKNKGLEIKGPATAFLSTALDVVLNVKQTKYYRKDSDPTKNLQLKIYGHEFGLNRKNLRLYSNYYSENNENYYQCTMEPVVEFWMFAGKMFNKNKEREENIEQQKREEASKNQL